MWMKMIAFGATTSILALGACASSEGEYAEGRDSTVTEDTGEAPLAAADGQFCGGIGNLPCPTGYTCVDAPNDGCDPRTGGRDCGGICVADSRNDGSRTNQSACRQYDADRSYVSRNPDVCAAILFRCEEGKQPFFDECGCGCENVVPCGSNFCGPGTYCCNASCGICAPLDGACIQIACEEPLN